MSVHVSAHMSVQMLVNIPGTIFQNQCVRICERNNKTTAFAQVSEFTAVHGSAPMVERAARKHVSTYVSKSVEWKTQEPIHVPNSRLQVHLPNYIYI